MATLTTMDTDIQTDLHEMRNSTNGTKFSGKHLQKLVQHATQKLKLNPNDAMYKEYAQLVTERERHNIHITNELTELSILVNPQHNRIVPASVVGSSQVFPAVTTPTATLSSSAGVEKPLDLDNVRDSFKDFIKTNDGMTPTHLENIVTSANDIIKQFREGNNLKDTDPQIMTLRSVMGTLLLKAIDVHQDLKYTLNNKGIQIIPEDANNQKQVQKATDLQLKFNTLITNKYLSFQDLKQGILYAAPSFETYTTSSRLVNGTSDKKANINGYVDYLKTSNPEKKYTIEENMIINSPGMFQDINMPKLIESYKNLDQINNVVATPEQASTPPPVNVTKAPPVVANSTNTINSTPVPPSTIPSSPVVDGIAQVAANTADNIGGMASGVLSIIGKAAEKNPIGGAVVALATLFLGWKLLTGKIGSEKNNIPGWMLLLGGSTLWGAIAAGKDGQIPSNMKSMIDALNPPIKDTSENTNSLSKENTNSNNQEQLLETPVLTSFQKKATDTVMRNTDIQGTFNVKKTPSLEQYVTLINGPLQNMQMNDEILTSIFTGNKLLPESITHKFEGKKYNPITLKKILRVYLGSTAHLDTKNITGAIGNMEKTTFLTGLAQKGVTTKAPNAIGNRVTLGTITLSQLTATIYSSGNKENNTVVAQSLTTVASKKEIIGSMIEKIKGYNIQINGKNPSKDHISSTVTEYDNGFKATVAFPKPGKINGDINRLDPIEVFFNHNGDLTTSEIKFITDIPAFVGGEPTYGLTQKDNTIILTKK